MKFWRYSRWDGTQPPFDHRRKEMIDHFMENIMKGMSPGTSLAQMLWEGFPLAGMDFRVMGLEEMVAALEEQKDDLFSTYTLEKIFEQPMEDFRFLLQNEAMKRREIDAKPPPSYDSLPPGLLEKLHSLKAFDFIDDESRRMHDAWQTRRQDIRDLYDFYSEYADRFYGEQELDFDKALALMRQFQELDRLQRKLLSGRLEAIDPEQLRRMLGDDAQTSFNILLQLPPTLSGEGLVQGAGGRLEMTPRGLRRLGESAFGRLFYPIQKDRRGEHQGHAPQTGDLLPDSSHAYRYGDRFDLDLTRTLLQSIPRGATPAGAIALDPDGFFVREREQLVTTTTVVLLDLSWSMSRDGRFEAAKKVALALDHYIRSRFPKDKVHTIGFSTEAVELKGRELAMAVWDAYRPFTNLQGALQLAMQLIKRSGNRNNRVLVITDGQPTAYYVHDELHVEFPETINGLSRNACMATLAEVRRVTAQGMHIDTFMLDDSPVLLEFTREMARINKGRAVLCRPGKLGELILVEEIKRRGGRT
ncbi:VWA domain-containing protein [Desulfatitalea tepidiphila]|uniref:VWA domain-containing protein n=1 Tax=Desulfatitalea tepidiphila TaxID=1185843 RepID=UPI0006B4A78D|nr:VWA domain-containing protein [Desulfatitalea tepidiphila]